MTDFEKAKSLLDGLGNGYRVMDEEFIADLKAKYEWPDLGYVIRLFAQNSLPNGAFYFYFDTSGKFLDTELA